MALRTLEEYKASLRDNRTVYFRGQRVDDVTTHPVIGVATEHAALDFRMAEDPRHRDLAVVTEDGKTFSRFYKLPRNADDLLKRSALIEAGTRVGETLVALIKEIGADAIFGLQLTAHQMDERLGTGYLDRVHAFYEHCRDNDLATAVAQTDVKGDRSLGPAQQAHPDYYLRVVEERADGIVVRGAKVHTSATTNVNEIIVLPTRTLAGEDKAYAVAFAVPVNTPGLKLIVSPFNSAKHHPAEHPISSRHKMMETTTVFDDVFVPWERVFMQGEWEYAGPLALAFVAFHRFTAISYKLPLVDALVGAAFLMAEYNGISRAGHVREKLIRLVAYAETLRALTYHAAEHCRLEPPGIAVPNRLIANMAKYHFAHGYHAAVQDLQDISGGLLATAPSQEDWENPELRPYLERYLGGKAGVSAEDRLKLFHLVSDLTASDYGGYQEVLAIHAEGSLEAEKLTMFREYNPADAVAFVKSMAGIQ